MKSGKYQEILICLACGNAVQKVLHSTQNTTSTVDTVHKPVTRCYFRCSCRHLAWMQASTTSREPTVHFRRRNIAIHIIHRTTGITIGVREARLHWWAGGTTSSIRTTARPLRSTCRLRRTCAPRRLSCPISTARWTALTTETPVGCAGLISWKLNTPPPHCEKENDHLSRLHSWLVVFFVKAKSWASSFKIACYSLVIFNAVCLNFFILGQPS